MMADPRAVIAEAQDAQRAGHPAKARRIVEHAIAQFPAEAGLHHMLGKLLLADKSPADAARCFAQAAELAQGNTAFVIDRAIALTSAQQGAHACRVLQEIEDAAGNSALYCSARAAAERGGGDLAAAARWYDRALAIEPSRPRAMQGRATVALERGEPDAVARFDAILRGDTSNPYPWYGKAQALDVAGQAAEARIIAEALTHTFPSWADALKLLTQLRLAAGEKDVTAAYANAAQRAPQDVNIYTEWAQQLSSLNDYETAADIIRRARRIFPDHKRLALLEAIYSGDARITARAEQIFADIQIDTEERWVHEARHAMRSDQWERAEQALDKAIGHNPFSISAWASRGILWRLTGDPRAAWLHAQEGLVQLLPLRDAETVLPPVTARLAQIHDKSACPLGQSLRGGTQTRGRLFDRHEAEFAALRRAIAATLADYRQHLPAADAAHPLLRHRDSDWRIAGSWSVRLAGGSDHHAAHIHPQGIVSSALYCALPTVTAQDDPQAGWLELGRAPAELGCDLAPLAALEPREGYLALFPSTLYHGTRPFGDGRRLTVAFDVSENSET